MKNNQAFTLAEALITMGIIGIIAALTIPGMKSHSDEASFIASTKKAYTTAQEATAALEVQYGNSEFWSWADAKAMKKRYYDIMNGIPLTRLSDTKTNSYVINTLKGAADPWTTVTAKNADGDETNWFQTQDGMLWMISTWKEGDGATAHTYNLIYVDTNGPSGPNVVGIDVHAFVVNNDGVYPMGAKMHYGNSYWACTNYVIKTGKMPWVGDSSYTSCGDSRITDVG